MRILSPKTLLLGTSFLILLIFVWFYYNSTNEIIQPENKTEALFIDESLDFVFNDDAEDIKIFGQFSENEVIFKNLL